VNAARVFLLACVLALAGCGGSSTAAPASTASHAPAATISHAPASPSPAPAVRLTIRQAAVIYARLTAPANKASAIAQADYAASAPWSVQRADLLAYDRDVRALGVSLRAVRWPANVQPWVTAMVVSWVPATLACDRAAEAAGSVTASVTVTEENPSCQAVSGPNTNAEEIRTLLGLPPVPGG
jgi:hypothetical protein